MKLGDLVGFGIWKWFGGGEDGKSVRQYFGEFVEVEGGGDGGGSGDSGGGGSGTTATGGSQRIKVSTLRIMP